MFKIAPRGYVYIDDEAGDSDEGVLVDPEDKGGEEYDMVANESDAAFIDDRDPETLSVGSSTGYKSSGADLDAIERKLNAKKRSPSPVKQRSRMTDVIDVGGSSSGEDLTAMDADDRDDSPDWDPPEALVDDTSSKGKKRTVQMRKRSAVGSEDDTDPEVKRPSKSSIARRLDFKEDTASSKAHAVGSSKISPLEAESDEEPPSTVFLEDIETYKAYFDPRAPCGVNDVELQDPVLIDSYADLPPLPSNRRILPAFDPQGLSYEEEADVKGGRVKFSSWKRHLKHMLPDNSYGALTFKEAEPNFINPSRVSPLRLSRQASPGSSPNLRLLVGTRIAVCVSAVFCSESVLVEAGRIGPKSDRVRKWVSGIFHNQEWERFEALCCLVFGETVMYGQISSKKAVAFQTMISPDPSVGSKGDVDHRFDTEAPADMFSPIVKKGRSKSTSTQKPKFKSKTLLAHNDVVPVYDARKQIIDFQVDLERLDETFPRFSGEIPFSSFVIVGYTLSSYQAARSGSSEKVAHLGCNVVWVIVCGTPVLRR
ncbi:hypothetical protein DFH06DRAFT_1325703 [Mycena polygramma]|nr:hypothetical protein DFH06DRAFT_1325703 [Mycena polygramma]